MGSKTEYERTRGALNRLYISFNINKILFKKKINIPVSYLSQIRTSMTTSDSYKKKVTLTRTADKNVHMKFIDMGMKAFFSYFLFKNDRYQKRCTSVRSKMDRKGNI